MFYYYSQFGKVLENSNFLLVFIFVFSFSLATICFSFLISTFFSRANLAAACGGFIFFACFLPYNFLNLDNQDYSLSVLISSVSIIAFNIYEILSFFRCLCTIPFSLNAEPIIWCSVWYRMLLFCKLWTNWCRSSFQQFCDFTKRWWFLFFVGMHLNDARRLGNLYDSYVVHRGGLSR